MQVILTEKEYSKLVLAAEINGNIREYVNIKKLQEFCTEVSNRMRIIRDWDEEKTLVIVGCILTGHPEGYSIGYCDDCPSRKLCPSDRKKWSK